METKAAKRILTAPENTPYPEKLENLLTIEEAADRWNIPAVTIRKKCKEGFFGHFARKMGGQWIITPEAMCLWCGMPQKGEIKIYADWTYCEIKKAYQHLRYSNQENNENIFVKLALIALYKVLRYNHPQDVSGVPEPQLYEILQDAD